MVKSKKNIVAIIQARMGSTRLPGKVLMEVQGEPLLKIMMSRAVKSKLINKIVIATSHLPKDDQIQEFCQKYSYECFRGSENDVLSRYYDCAKKLRADVIVRLTGDCPLIDPEIIDDVIYYYTEKKVDYAANTLPPETSTFPDGSDVEVFSYEALEKAYKKVKKDSEREHVTHYFWRNDDGIKTAQLRQGNNLSNYRFTVDYPEDIEVVDFIVKKLIELKTFGNLKEIIGIQDMNPEIQKINSMYYSGIGWEKS